jgi:two-component system chemotaxis response regulator CheV
MNTEQQGVMGNVDMRTQMAGQNRMEMLIFSLGAGKQKFGINVFKVREVIHCPKLADIPHAGSAVIGMASVRGETIPVIDLARATQIPGGITKADIDPENPPLMIVSEYNMRVQAFIVSSVDKIINRSWDQITPPPKGLPNGHYLTSVTEVESEIIGILDVERVLAETNTNPDDNFSSAMSEKVDAWKSQHDQDQRVMVVGDSMMARKQLTKCLEDLGFLVETFNDGQEAFDHLLSLEEEAGGAKERYKAIISDIEMPRMDGYTFVTKLKELGATQGIRTVLHSSLSGGFNKAMVEKVGADGFIEKFSADKLAKFVMELVE